MSTSRSLPDIHWGLWYQLFSFPFSSWKPSLSPLDDLTSKLCSSDISYFNFFSSTPFQSSISVVTPGMALPPKPESTLRTTGFSTCPTPYAIWIYPSTFPRLLIHQPSYLFSKASMSLWTSLPSLPRKDSMDSGTSMTVTSTLNSPIPLIFHHTYPASPHPQINPTISICYSCL